MRTLLSLFLGAGLFSGAARAEISSGGDFSLDLSLVDSAGGADMSGGIFEAQGAMGQAAEISRSGSSVLRRGFYDPPRFKLQSALTNVAQDPSASVSLTIPRFSVPSPTFDAVFRRDPASSPLSIDPAKILEANRKIQTSRGELSQAQAANIWEIHFMDETGLRDDPLSATGRVSFRYLDADSDGVVDGTSPPVRAKTLNLWRLDEASSQWVKMPNAAVDTGQKRLGAPLNHLSVYALIGGLDESVADVYAYPVPYRPFGPGAGTGAGQTGTEAAGVTFANLPSEGILEIYTLSGKLARRMEIPANLATAKLAWDVRNSAGDPMASGVYLWRIVSGKNSKKGRLMIIK